MKYNSLEGAAGERVGVVLVFPNFLENLANDTLSSKCDHVISIHDVGWQFSVESSDTTMAEFQKNGACTLRRSDSLHSGKPGGENGGRH